MKKRRILLVDDDVNVLDALNRTLRNDAEEIFKCTNAFDAYELIEREKGDIDLVISDNKMPVVEGTALLVAIRRNFPDIVRIMLTGQSSLKDAERAVNGGEVFKFLVKPCEPEVLIEIVNEAFQHKDLCDAKRSLIEEVKKGIDDEGADN